MSFKEQTQHWNQLPHLEDEDLQNVVGGMFGVRVAWQILTRSPPAGQPNGQGDPLTIADRQAKAQAQAQAQWRAAIASNPSLIIPNTLLGQIQWRADQTAGQMAAFNASLGGTPALTAGKH